MTVYKAHPLTDLNQHRVCTLGRSIARASTRLIPCGFGANFSANGVLVRPACHWEENVYFQTWRPLAQSFLARGLASSAARFVAPLAPAASDCLGRGEGWGMSRWWG